MLSLHATVSNILSSFCSFAFNQSESFLADNISIINLHSAVPGVTSSTEPFFGLLSSWYEVSVGTAEMLGSSSQFLTMPTERFFGASHLPSILSISAKKKCISPGKWWY